VAEALKGREALLADSVGLALLVVLETLSPPERLAFVLAAAFRVRPRFPTPTSRRSAKSSTPSSRPRAAGTSSDSSPSSTRTSC
jgi:hypothetical protein